MKILKFVLIFSLLFIFFIGGYIVNEYYNYEQKQNDVRAFQKLAFKGYSAVNARNDKQALEAYEKAIAIHDKEASSLADLAMLYRKKGELKKARVFYKKAYDASNENYKHLYNLALVEYLLKEYKKSIDTLINLIHVDRNSSKYYKFLALNYYALGEKEKAYGYFRVLDDRKFQLNDKLLQGLKKEYDALETKPKSLQIVFKYQQEKNIEKLVDIMEKYKFDGYDIKALRTAQKILMKNPDNNLANKIASELYYNHGELGQAYDYAVNINEHDAKSLEILGAVYQNAGKYEKALEAYEKSYAKEPKKELLRAMTVCSMHLKKQDDMNNYIKRLNKVDPYLTTQLVYAIETKSGIKHTFWDKVVYLAQLQIFKNYCKIKGCDGA